MVRVEAHRNGELAWLCGSKGRYLRVEQRQPATARPGSRRRRARADAEKAAQKPRQKSTWMEGFFKRPAPPLHQALKISNATS